MEYAILNKVSKLEHSYLHQCRLSITQGLKPIARHFLDIAPDIELVETGFYSLQFFNATVA